MRTPRPSRLAVMFACLLLASPVAAQMPAGRIAEASGPISLRGAAGGWSAAPRGSQFAEGQSLRTGARSRAELDLGANRIGLDPDTVLRIDSANPAAPAATLEQGRAMLLLRSLQPGQAARLETPRGTVSLIQPGLYVIEAGDASRPTTIGVSRGMAQVYGPGVSMMVAAGQTGVVGGTDGRPASLRAGVAEGFLADDPSAAALPQVVRPTLPPPPPSPGQYAEDPRDAVGDLPGGDALLRDGSWASVPEYGQVWYPPVAQGWSPYDDSWGDYRSWGYAPWYYGTWIMIGPRWGWMPPPRRNFGQPTGPGYRPGYSRGRPPPALAQPHRRPPLFAPPPVGQGGGRPGYGQHWPPGPASGRPPVTSPPPPPLAAPHVYSPRPAGPSPFVAPPPTQGPRAYQGTRPIAPPAFAPSPSLPRVNAPPPAPPRAAPPAAAPHIYAPRAPAPSFNPPAAPHPVAPRPAGPRRCGPPGAPC